jgi:hypothetical protein
MGLMLALALGGCGGDGNGVTDPPTPDPTLQIGVNPSAVSVEAGGAGQFTVSVTRGGGFAGAVNLTVEGLPSGVTANAPAVAAGASSGVVTLSASASASAGNASLTVRAQGTGVAPATATVALTVTVPPPPPVGSFTLSLEPSTLSLEQGSSGSATVTLSRTDFDGAVQLTASGAPQGVTLSLDPAAPTGNTSALSIQIGEGASPGTATLTVTGSAEGLESRSATLALTITERPSGTGNVVFTFCGDTGLPLWVAYQDGDGPWTRVQGTGHVYAFQVNAARGGVAWVTREDGFAQTNVFLQSREELITYGAGQCAVEGELKTVNGSVSGLGQTEFAFVSMGGASATAMGFTGGAFTLENVPPGPQDLVAGRAVLSGTSLSLDRILVRRNLDPADGSTLPPLNFQTEGFAPATATATVNGLAAGEETVAVSALVTERGSIAPFLNFEFSGNTTAFAGLPSDRLAAGDLHWLNVVAVGSTQGSSVQPPDTRQVAQIFREVGNRTVTLGPAMTPPTVSSVQGGANARLRGEYAIQGAEYNRWWFFTYQQPSREVGVTIGASRAWQGSSNTLVLTLPDFSPVQGWDAAWGLQAGTSTIWTGTATGWAGQGGVVFPGFEDGTVLLSASRSGSITP